MPSTHACRNDAGSVRVELMLVTRISAIPADAQSQPLLFTHKSLCAFRNYHIAQSGYHTAMNMSINPQFEIFTMKLSGCGTCAPPLLCHNCQQFTEDRWWLEGALRANHYELMLSSGKSNIYSSLVFQQLANLYGGRGEQERGGVGRLGREGEGRVIGKQRNRKRKGHLSLSIYTSPHQSPNITTSTIYCYFAGINFSTVQNSTKYLGHIC